MRVVNVSVRNRRQVGDWTQVSSALYSASCGSSSHSGEGQSAADPAFRSVCRSATGFHVWRVEHLQVIAVPRDQWGTFYEGDSYLVFASSERGQPAGPHTRVREVRGGAALDQHLHVWLGAAAAADDSGGGARGAAAYKAAELDEALAGRAVQHREQQGHESARFQTYFKHTGIRVLRGSQSASRLPPASPGPAARLFRVSGAGRRCASVTELPSVAWRHCASSGVFLLATKHAVFVWIGRYACAADKLQAARVAVQVKDELDARFLVFVDEGREVLLPADKFSLLAEVLDPRRAGIEVHQGKPPPGSWAQGLDASNLERAADRPRVTLYHCADKDDTCMVTEVKSGPLDQEDLSHSDSYIVDNGSVGVWVWLGRLVGERERLEAVRNAQGFVRKKGYPTHTPITRVTDGSEPAEFRCLFRAWRGKDDPPRPATTVHTRMDALALRDNPRLAADLRLLDDGCGGESRMWRVARTGLVGVPAKRSNRLHSAECYVLHYSYGHPEHHVIFYWLGRTASGERHSAAALWAQEKSRELGDNAVIVRAVEGREPPCLRAVFRGKLTVLFGEAPPGDDGGSSSGLPASFLLRVEGSQNYDTRSVQVLRRASSLSSGAVFVLRTKRGGWYLWCGRGSTGDEREMAKRIALSAGGGDVQVVYEGHEREDFWAALGGAEDYGGGEDDPSLTGHDARPNRLFSCLNAASATLAVDELPYVSQQDLDPEHVALLDARDTLLVWIGKHTSREGRQRAINAALEFLKTDPACRDLDTPIILVRQGNEPPMFIGFFPTWNPRQWDDYHSFEELRAQLEGRPLTRLPQPSPADLPCVREFAEQEKFPLQLLLDPDITRLPHTVDVFRKELHLTHSDFVSVFGMDYPTFAQLPLWRQHSLKKAAGLF